MKNKYTKKQLKEKLLARKEELGRVPKINEMSNNYPSAYSYIKYFGSWNNALKECNLEITNKRYSTEKLLEILIDKTEELGYVPRRTDIDLDKNCPTIETYDSRFESYEKAIEMLGLIPQEKSYRITKEQLLEDLINFNEELGHVPTAEEVANNKNISSATTYIKRFGTYTNALKESGLNPDRSISKEEIIVLIRKAAKELGHVPSYRDFEKLKYLTPGVCSDRFGSWNNALRSSGLEPIQENNYSKKELIEYMRKMSEEIGDHFVKNTLAKKKGPNPSTIERHFGSWNNALKEAKIKPYEKDIINQN